MKEHQVLVQEAGTHDVQDPPRNTRRLQELGKNTATGNKKQKQSDDDQHAMHKKDRDQPSGFGASSRDTGYPGVPYSTTTHETYQCCKRYDIMP